MKKDYEPYKRMVRFLFSAVLIGLEVMVYGHVWLKYYNGFMEFPYNRTGNWLIMAVYGILLLVFSAIYGGLRIGYLRIFNIIYSQVLTSFCTNIIIYLQITLLTKHFQNPVPLLAMTGVEGVWITVWSVLCTQIYLRIYPPRKVVLVYGEHPVYSLMVKLYGRADRYDIKELVHISKGMDVIKEKVKQYEGVILCDIPSQMRNQLLKYCYNESIRTYMVPKISDIIIRSAENLHLFDTPLMLARYTKDGKIFDIYKFRSMIVNAEAAGTSVPAADRDPRITPVGRVIRALRIDELPQFINILKGEMSVVGPRPERVEHVELYTKDIPEFVYRLKVKGGLTGYAQVYGKYNTTAYDKLKLDLMYIQNYSIWLDIEIIFKTIKILLIKESTEGFSEEQAAAITKECGDLTETMEEKDRKL